METRHGRRAKENERDKGQGHLQWRLGLGESDKTMKRFICHDEFVLFSVI